jgi:hypothetical protein
MDSAGGTTAAKSPSMTTPTTRSGREALIHVRSARLQWRPCLMWQGAHCASPLPVLYFSGGCSSDRVTDRCAQLCL